MKPKGWDFLDHMVQACEEVQTEEILDEINGGN